MSHWNYRVVHRQWQRAQLGDGRVGPTEVVEEYAIHEVYYDDAGAVTKMTEDAMPVDAETVDGVRWMLDAMREALDKPVLEYDMAFASDAADDEEDSESERSRDA